MVNHQLCWINSKWCKLPPTTTRMLVADGGETDKTNKTTASGQTHFRCWFPADVAEGLMVVSCGPYMVAYGCWWLFDHVWSGDYNQPRTNGKLMMKGLPEYNSTLFTDHESWLQTMLPATVHGLDVLRAIMQLPLDWITVMGLERRISDGSVQKSSLLGYGADHKWCNYPQVCMFALPPTEDAIEKKNINRFFPLTSHVLFRAKDLSFLVITSQIVV